MNRRLGVPGRRNLTTSNRGGAIALAVVLAVCGVLVGIVPAAAAAPKMDTYLVRVAQAGGSQQVQVIVRETTPATSAAEQAVRALGGRVTKDLSLIGSFAALVPARQLFALQRSAAIQRIWLDGRIVPQAIDMSVYDHVDPNTVWPQIWQSSRMAAGGWDGRGVGVALIDSGVADVEGLGGRVVQRVDLTPDLDGVDHFGHGTHMAGIIAGDGTGAGSRSGFGSILRGSAILNATAPAFSPSDVGKQITIDGAGSSGLPLVTNIATYKSPTQVLLKTKASLAVSPYGPWRITGVLAGVAPGASIISIKAAGWNGATDVSVIIEAIQWAVDHQVVHNIRVLCLAFGTDSTQSYSVDPLNYAVEQAWFSGIFVVVSAGNRGVPGDFSNVLSKPGDDPFVLTVGAADVLGTTSLSDDKVAPFSSHDALNSRKLYTKPDVVAPGISLVSLLAPDSYVVEKHAAAILTLETGKQVIKGTGTSQATAVVAGIAALMFQAYPTMTPNVAKMTIKRTGKSLSSAYGLKEVDLLLAVKAAVAKTYRDQPANLGLVPSTGTGSLELSRGTLHILTDLNEDAAPEVLTGEVDVHNVPWDGRSWTGRSWTEYAWDSKNWFGRSWTGRSWTGMGWDADSWHASTWQGQVWTSTQWDDYQWSAWGW